MIAMFGKVTACGDVREYTDRDGRTHRYAKYNFCGRDYDYDGSLVIEVADGMIDKFALCEGWEGTITAVPRIVQGKAGCFTTITVLSAARINPVGHKMASIMFNSKSK